MRIAVPRETAAGERRVALTPDAVKALVKDGIQVAVQSGAGASAGFDDAAYTAAGARVTAGAGEALAADLVLKVAPPSESEIAAMREGAAYMGFLRPLDAPRVAQQLAQRRTTAFALELVPRITRAQAMDALSSQANLAGYRAVLLAAISLPRIFPMLVTAAGTIQPARAFVIGAGVAGLQAIATSRRLGAVTSAYDLRPAVKEQVQSLGARFVELPIEAQDAQDAGGYARAQDESFYSRQRELLGDGAILDDGDVVADRTQHRQLVADNHDRDAEARINVAQGIEQRAGGFRVEGGGRLVAQQHGRAAGQRAGDGHSLLLAAR